MFTFLTVLLVLVGGVGGYWLFNFNRLKALESRCEQANADIDVQIRQRHDLIPNIIQTVHNFAGQEKHMIDSVLEARTAAMTAAMGPQQIIAEMALGNQLTKLMSVAENYPALASQRDFAELRAELSDTENKIAASRRFLNLATNEYNTMVSQFPGSLIAARSGMGKQRFYGLGEDRMFVEDAPMVKPV